MKQPIGYFASSVLQHRTLPIKVVSQQLEHLCHEAVLQEILKLHKEDDFNVKYHNFIELNGLPCQKQFLWQQQRKSSNSLETLFLVRLLLPIQGKCTGLLFHLIILNNTHTHTRQDSSGRVIGPTPRPLPDNTKHGRNTNAQAGFEPPIPESKRPQTYAVDRAATGIGTLETRGLVGRNLLMSMYEQNKMAKFGYAVVIAKKENAFIKHQVSF